MSYPSPLPPGVLGHGKQAFQGDDVTEILAAVVRAEPDWSGWPEKTPPAIRNLVRRCLEKNLRRRLPHIGEARMVIEDVLSGAVPDKAAAAAPAAPARKGRERIAWAVAAVAILAGLGLAAFTFLRRAPEARAVRFLVSPPDA